MKFIKKLFCRHKHMTHLRTDLVKQDDSAWKMVHQWR